MVRIRFRCPPEKFDEAEKAVKKAMDKFKHHRGTFTNRETQTIEIEGNPPHGFIHEIIAEGFNLEML